MLDEFRKIQKKRLFMKISLNIVIFYRITFHLKHSCILKECFDKSKPLFFRLLFKKMFDLLIRLKYFQVGI